MGFIKRSKTPVLPPQFLIVGLGNPGPEYRGTRHNVGFEVIESVAKSAKIDLRTHRFQAQIGIGPIAGESVVLAKPTTFTNRSGLSVVALMKHFQIQPQNLMVIADDLDLEVGKIRLRAQGSSGGHNGHKSIIQHIGTQEYPRLKIGIGKEGEVIDHVLTRFNPEERIEIDSAVRRCQNALQIWIESGIDQAMNETNRGSN